MPKKKAPATRARTPLKKIKGENIVYGSVRVGRGGKFEQKTVRYTPLSKSREKRELQEAELRDLKQAVRRKWQSLEGQAHHPVKSVGNPYHPMQALGMEHRIQLAGRGAFLHDFLALAEAEQTVYLGGNSGSGKTSLLQAGAIPALLAKGHLPLLVSTQVEALERSIKMQFLASIDTLEFLREMSLAEFVQRVSDELGKGKKLFVIVDDFEMFYQQTETELHRFKAGWSLSIKGGAPDVHWIFSIHLGSAYHLNLFQPEIQPFTLMKVLAPLTRDAAKEAILIPARERRFRIDRPVLELILDRLGGQSIDPAQLQIVCHILAGGTGAPAAHWTMEHYQACGGVEGILSNYLDIVIGRLPPDDQEPAWQILGSLADKQDSKATEEWLVEQMKPFGLSQEDTGRILESLRNNHLVEREPLYHLTSASLRERVALWLENRSAREQARRELLQQLRSIGGSALRGLIGGAIGFGLAYVSLPYINRPTALDERVPFYLYNVGLRALLGGVAGFIMILAIDLALASYRGKNERLQWPLGIAAGALTFGSLLAMHTLLGYFGADFSAALIRSALEGGLWGAIAGAGAIWVLKSTGRAWWRLATASLAGGIVLVFADAFLKGLNVVSTPAVFLAGIVMPLFLIGFASLGKGPSLPGDES